MVLSGDVLLLGVIGLLSSVLLLLQLYFWHKFSYWRKRGVPCKEPTLLFGNYKDCVLQKECVGQFLQRMYNESAGKPFFGIYVFTRPALLLRDPDLIKTILVKEFNTLYERNARSNIKTDPLSQNLFLLKGPAWKQLRVKLTPIFTSFRMRQMFPLMSTCSDQLTDYIEKHSNLGKSLEMKEVMAKYATDVISTCAFGIKSNCLLDPNAEFREFGRKIFNFSAYRSFEFMSSFMLPFVVKVMNIKFFSNETTKFLRKVFLETMSEREERNIERDDFMQLLIQLKNEDAKANSVAQHNMTSKNTAQENVETLRKFPVLPVLDRVAGRDFVIPGTNITIEKGTTIYVPLLGLHMDPDVFPDPDHYDPERFSEENRKTRHQSMYLPFGEGPKFCIGKTFGFISVKTSLVNILANFEVSTCAETPKRLQLDPKAIILANISGIYLKFTKLKY